MLCHFVWLIVTLTVKARDVRAMVDEPEIRLLNVDKVWEKGFTGKGIVVAVVDDGVTKHGDLGKSYIESLSYDFVNLTTSKQQEIKSHGTRCAGVIAGKRNGTCRNGGFAYKAQLADLKMLNGTLAVDSLTAKALQYKRQEIDIYSNSWGPSDNGYLVHGPGKLVKEALKQGTKWGRRGRGSIFVFSTGNGGVFKDSCAFDGYVNSIYTIAIGAVTKSEKTPYYAEPCSAVMAAAYGDDVKTCDITGCVNDFGRTSAAAAMASGIIALLLEATNNTLTWRDVHHLIVRTSRPNREVNDGKDWIVNGAGLMVHPFLGFGIIDANKLVQVATESWQTVPVNKRCTITYKFNKPWTFNRGKKSFVIDTQKDKGCSKINHIEYVKVKISSSFERRGLLQMYLESPLKTKSKLIYERLYDTLTGKKIFNNLPVTSLHFWGESVSGKNGTWRILFESSSFRYRRTEGKVSKLKITFYGTEEDPIRNSGLVKEMISCPYRNGVAKFWMAYGTKCCGNIGLYDESRAKCCNGRKIVKKMPVCGYNYYDQCKEICCDGKVHEKIEGTFCCGQQTYNTKRQICCHKIPEAKFKCERVRYNYWSHYHLRYAEAECHYYYGLTYRPKYYQKCPDPCANSPCKNGGKCLGDVEKSTFICQCLQSYRGETCKERVDPCEKSPCRNRGECQSSDKSTFICKCAEGYEGKTCEKAIILSKPTATISCNNGTINGKIEGHITSCCNGESYDSKTQICCNNKVVAKYQCIKIWNYRLRRYSLNYAEKHCDFNGRIRYGITRRKKCPDPCEGNPCKNQGTCEGNVESFTFACRCHEWYEGETCEKRACIDHLGCEDWKKIGGFCEPEDSTYYCPKACGNCK